MAETQLVRVDPKEYGVDENHAKQVEATFRPMLDKMTGLEERFNEVVALEIGPDTCEQARKLRMEYVKVRTGTASIHKDLKAFFLAAGRFIDGWKNAQLFASQGKEDRLKAIEEHYERIEQARIAKLAEERTALLEPYGVAPMHMDLGRMEDGVFGHYLTGVKLQHEQKLEAERRAEADRLAAIEADREERRRQAEENARLKAEAEKREAEMVKERKKLEAARKAAEENAHAERMAAENWRRETEAKAAKERADIEAKARADREAAAAEAEQRRIKFEEARAKAEREAEAKIKAERESREKLERELQAKREAEERAEAERVAAEQAELAKGDEERFVDFVDQLTELTTKYSFKSKAFRSAHAKAVAGIRNILADIEALTEEVV